MNDIKENIIENNSAIALFSKPYENNHSIKKDNQNTV